MPATETGGDIDQWINQSSIFYVNQILKTFNIIVILCAKYMNYRTILLGGKIKNHTLLYIIS